MDDSRLSLDLSKLESVTAYITPNCLNQAFRWFHCIVFEGLDCCLWYNKETCVDSRRSSWIGKHSLVEPRLQRRVLTTHPLNHRRRRLWIILQVTLLCFHSPPLYPHLHSQPTTQCTPILFHLLTEFNAFPLHTWRRVKEKKQIRVRSMLSELPTVTRTPQMEPLFRIPRHAHIPSSLSFAKTRDSVWTTPSHNRIQKRV